MNSSSPRILLIFREGLPGEPNVMPLPKATHLEKALPEFPFPSLPKVTVNFIFHAVCFLRE